ncbi:MAG: T9SS C-terminal target domain-containing protein [Bacteroidetes bacterium]|nr:T9SS C-terminal target domain-containing protein [Bacteroidota bacterium]
MKKIILILQAILLAKVGLCQYHPPAGKTGSSAIYKDSSIIKNWAKSCKIIRGWKDIAHKDSGFTTIGDSLSAIGAAGENGIVSLGDSGIAICSFSQPIIDGDGWDFAVFENSFSDEYLELAFVEVSSDGNKFFRFPCHSLNDTSTQTTAFGTTNAEKINNLAGKYRFGFGTPFDIGELPYYKDLDKQNIRFVKIVDVIGSLNNQFATFDTAKRKINDPYPTLFASGGFDLDAIGVINEKPISGVDKIDDNIEISTQNPLGFNSAINIKLKSTGNLKLIVIDYKGSVYKEFEVNNNSITLNPSDIPFGFFILKFAGKNSYYYYKAIKL